MRIDLNADVGERVAPEDGGDEPLLRVVTSANIACGFHAGDPRRIRRTLVLARTCGVAAGAHPSLADRDGFGRRVQPTDPQEVEDLVLYQLSALLGMARAESMELSHIKPHGWLYHLASEDDGAARAIVRATASCRRGLRLVGFAGSRLVEAAREAGLPVSAEAFADRVYDPRGRLMPRERPGAVITDPAQAVRQALGLVLEHRVTAADGRTTLNVSADTLCVHGDTPGAVRLAEAVRSALEREGVVVAAPGPSNASA